MLAVIIKILSVVGIVLLVLLGILTLALLLVLFLPVVYRLDAKKNGESIRANIKARWLFGLVRAGYSYPEPGSLIIKVLWFSLFDSGKSHGKSKKDSAASKSTVSYDTSEKNNMDASDSGTTNAPVGEEASDSKSEAEQAIMPGQTESRSTDEADSNHSAGCLSEKLFAKYEKIKYTLKQIYDRIKHILKNISFYKKLLEDEETKLLFSHTCKRFKKIFRHIRPRKLKADVIFGTGSPDTTGYAYGIYGMLSPQLGKDVYVTPDFTQQILEGSVYAAGHITIIHLLLNLLAVLLDRRLRIFIRRIKAHSNKTNPVSEKAVANM